MNIPEKYQITIDKIVSVARKFLSEGGEITGFVFLGKSDLPLLPCPMRMSNNAEKEISAMVIREIARATQAEFVIMISEAWTLDQTKISDEDCKKYLESHDGIAEHPDRMEVVMITLETPEGYWTALPPIKSLGGKSRGFDQVDFAFATQMEGRFASFLPHKTIH